MSFLFQGPHPNMVTTLLLPSPEEGNNKGLAASVQTLRSMNGTLFTYIKPKRERKRHQWDFITSRDKALEAKEFVNKYSDVPVQCTDHRGVQRVGYLTLNPLEQLGEGRAGGWGKIQEAYRFTIQFEERV